MLDFDFSNLEQFGGFLLNIIPFEGEQHASHFVSFSVVCVEYIQKESKTFSFSIIQKINQAKALE